jgi:hypothetical protein
MKDDQNKPNNPAKVYEDELHNRKGGDFFDSEEESEARDRAKVEKARHGYGQKMDAMPPDKATRIEGKDPDREAEEKE